MKKVVLEISSNKLQKGELNKHRSCIQNIQTRGFLLFIADLLAGGYWIRSLAHTFFLLFFYTAVKPTVLQSMWTCIQAFMSSWTANSPVTEVEEVLEMVTTVILACADVTGEAVVGVTVWLVLVGWVVRFTDVVVVLGWLVLVRWAVLVDAPGKFLWYHTEKFVKINNCTRPHLSCPNRMTEQHRKCHCTVSRLTYRLPFGKT